MCNKTYLSIDVYTAARQRMERVFDDFKNVYLSFSAGKDSAVMLNLALEVAREKGCLPLDVLILDLEAQYQHTADYIQRVADNPDVNLHWVCLPIHLRNAVSQIQPHWLCWDPDAKDLWVRDLPDHPKVISDEAFFPFFRRGMEFEEFVPKFGEWLAERHGGETAACMVGIRSDESLNRFRTIKNEKKIRWQGHGRANLDTPRRDESLNPFRTIQNDEKTRWQGHGWTTRVTPRVYNAYPIYDWKVGDIWTANGKFNWDYNKIYDLMHLAGLSLHAMRLCQPFGDDQRQGLWLFKILEPETWNKVVNRVAGANFGQRHVRETGNVMGNIRIQLPEGYTWKRYAKFLLATMPPYLAEHYRKKIAKFLKVWRKDIRSGKYPDVERIYDFADPRMEAARKAPSWRRVCKVILKNDYWCKGLSFSQTTREMDRQLALITKYMDL